MADDIAALGLSVGSQSVVKAASDLDKLTAASKTADQAAVSLARGTQTAGAAAAKLATQTTAAAGATNKMATDMTTGMSAIGRAALLVNEANAKMVRGMGAVATAARSVRMDLIAGMSAVGVAALAINAANAKMVQGMSASGRAFAAEQAAMVARVTLSADQIKAANAGMMAHGAQLTALRDRYLPLAAAQRQYAVAQKEIEQAVRIGAISEREKVAALRTAEGAYMMQVRAIQASQKAMTHLRSNAALGSHAMANLAFQINDVATMAAMGADPLRILASQAGQIYQVLSMGEGGVRGSLGYLKEVLMGMITPARLVTVGLAGIAIAGVSAVVSWGNAQRSITAALLGVGSAAGITAQSLNEIAIAAAAAGDATVGEAREMALQLAATGDINAEMIEKLVGLGRGTAKLFDEDLQEVGKRLARTFADPIKGVDELNKRYGAFDDTTVQNIKSLAAQNRLFEAQQMMFRGIEERTRAAEKAVSDLGRAWRFVTEGASEYFALVGRRGRLMFGIAEPYEQLADARERLDKKLKDNSNAYFDFQRTMNAPGIAAIRKEILELEMQLKGFDRLQADTWKNRQSVKAGEFVRGLVPDATARRELEDIKARLDEIDSSTLIKSGMSPESLAALERAKESISMRAEYYSSALGIAQSEHDLTLQNIAARTAGQRADIAYQETLNRLRREGDINAEAKARMAREEVLARAMEQNTRAMRERAFAQQQNIDSINFEISLIGKNAVEVARLRAEFEALADAKSQAFRDGRDPNNLSEGEIRGARAFGASNALATQARIRREVELELQFERDQMSRSEREQRVYSQLNSRGVLDNGQIVSTQAEVIAQQIRFNEVMRISQDLSKDFASGFIRDMKDGLSATEALANAMNRLADKFLDMAMDQAFSALFAPMSRGIAGGATAGASAASSAGGLFGGTIIPGILHQGGIAGSGNYPHRAVPASVFAGAPRYHKGGIAGLAPDEVPAILQRGERVLPKGAGAQAIAVHISTQIDARGAGSAEVARLEAAMAARDRTLERDVTNWVRDAIQRRNV